MIFTLSKVSKRPIAKKSFKQKFLANFHFQFAKLSVWFLHLDAITWKWFNPQKKDEKKSEGLQKHAFNGKNYFRILKALILLIWSIWSCSECNKLTVDKQNSAIVGRVGFSGVVHRIYTRIGFAAIATAATQSKDRRERFAAQVSRNRSILFDSKRSPTHRDELKSSFLQ